MEMPVLKENFSSGESFVPVQPALFHCFLSIQEHDRVCVYLLAQVRVMLDHK